jgi:hypothetical protein
LIREKNELIVSFPRKRERRQLNRDGIIDHVFLIGSEDVMVVLMFTYAYESNGLWHVHIDLEVYSVREMATDCIITIQRMHDVRAETVKLELKKGLNKLSRDIPIPYLDYWEPWDMGDQVMYTVKATIVEDSVELDSATDFVGFRRVEWSGNRILVNGKDEFVRGAEWAPLDLFLGEVEERKYLKMLSFALESNINMLMVPFREREDFYTLCDNLGIMVWQSEGPVAARRLLVHPSVVILPSQPKECTGTHIVSDRVFMRSMEFVRSERSVPGFVVTHEKFADMITSNEPNPKELVVVTQLEQARAVQKAIEDIRLRKGRIAGIILHRFNDAEPCVSESLIDFFGGTKLAYHKLRQTYNLSVAYLVLKRVRDGSLRGSLWVVNDLSMEFKNTVLQVLLSKKGDETEVFSRLMDVPKNSVVHAGDVKIPRTEKGAIVRTRLASKGYILGENNYDLGSITK